MTVEQIAVGALSLPSKARALLADRLVESLAPAEDGAVRQLWASEAQRRLDDVRSGRVQTIHGNEALARARNAVSRWGLNSIPKPSKNMESPRDITPVARKALSFDSSILWIHRFCGFIDCVDSSIVWIHRLCGVIDCVESALRSLCDAPTRWAVFEVDVRRRLVRVFPFAILCSVESDHVLIMAMMHLSREPGYWRNRRG